MNSLIDYVKSPKKKFFIVLMVFLLFIQSSTAFSAKDIWAGIRDWIDSFFQEDEAVSVGVPVGYATKNNKIKGLFSDLLEEDTTSTTSVTYTTSTQTTVSTSTTTTTVIDIPSNLCEGGKQTERATCFAIKEKDIRLCSDKSFTNFETWYEKKADCVYKVFDSFTATSECRMIAYDPQTTDWSDVCCKFMALKNEEVGVCDACTNNPEQKNLCYKTFSTYKQDLLYTDLDACLEFSDYSDYCIRKNAQKMDEVNICNHYEEKSQSKASCVFDVCNIRLDKNPDSNCCKEIPLIDGDDGERYKNRCYMKKAKVNGDPTWCKYMVSLDKIRGVGFQDNCIKDAAIKADDAEICMSIKQNWIRDECFELTIKDLSDCSKISDKTREKQCRYRLR